MKGTPDNAMSVLCVLLPFASAGIPEVYCV